MKITPLMLNGKPFDPRTVRPAIESIRKVLDAAPNGELFEKADVLRLAKCGEGVVYDFAQLEPDYVHKHGKRFIFGSKKAIAALKKFLAAQN